MLLEGKVAVIYGAGGKSAAQPPRRSRTRERGCFWPVGRSRTWSAWWGRLRPGQAASGVGIAEVDALDAGAVDCHADEVVAAAGSIDISFNLISHPFVQGSPVVEMSPEEYVDPVLSTVRSTFLTALAAARHMIGQRSGVILMFGGAADPPGWSFGESAGGAARGRGHAPATCLGARRVRRAGGDPADQRNPRDDRIAPARCCGRAATLEDVGGIAAFVASDHARTITGASINISSGTADARPGRSAGATRVSPEKPDRGPIGINGTELLPGRR